MSSLLPSPLKCGLGSVPERSRNTAAKSNVVEPQRVVGWGSQRRTPFSLLGSRGALQASGRGVSLRGWAGAHPCSNDFSFRSINCLDCITRIACCQGKFADSDKYFFSQILLADVDGDKLRYISQLRQINL